MQTNILDWLEATSARCPDAPAVGDDPDKLYLGTADRHGPPRRQFSGVPHDAAPPGGILPGKIRFRLCCHAWHSLRGLLLLGA